MKLYFGNTVTTATTIIIIAAVATPIARTQHMRQIWFYVMSGGVMMKILVMEVARIIVRL